MEDVFVGFKSGDLKGAVSKKDAYRNVNDFLQDFEFNDHVISEPRFELIEGQPEFVVNGQTCEISFRLYSDKQTKIEWFYHNVKLNFPNYSHQHNIITLYLPNVNCQPSRLKTVSCVATNVSGDAQIKHSFFVTDSVFLENLLPNNTNCLLPFLYGWKRYVLYEEGEFFGEYHIIKIYYRFATNRKCFSHSRSLKYFLQGNSNCSKLSSNNFIFQPRLLDVESPCEIALIKYASNLIEMDELNLCFRKNDLRCKLSDLYEPFHLGWKRVLFSCGEQILNSKQDFLLVQYQEPENKQNFFNSKQLNEFLKLKSTSLSEKNFSFVHKRILRPLSYHWISSDMESVFVPNFQPSIRLYDIKYQFLNYQTMSKNSQQATNQVMRSNISIESNFMKPLYLGWRRILISNNCKTTTFASAAVMYISPTGTHYWSDSELSRHMPSLGVSARDFCFEPILLKASFGQGQLYSSNLRHVNQSHANKCIACPFCDTAEPTDVCTYSQSDDIECVYDSHCPQDNEPDCVRSNEVVGLNRKVDGNGHMCSLFCFWPDNPNLPQLTCSRCLCMYHVQCAKQSSDSADITAKNNFICYLCENDLTADCNWMMESYDNMNSIDTSCDDSLKSTAFTTIDETNSTGFASSSQFKSYSQFSIKSHVTTSRNNSNPEFTISMPSLHVPSSLPITNRLNRRPPPLLRFGKSHAQTSPRPQISLHASQPRIIRPQTDVTMSTSRVDETCSIATRCPQISLHTSQGYQPRTFRPSSVTTCVASRKFLGSGSASKKAASRLSTNVNMYSKPSWQRISSKGTHTVMSSCSCTADVGSSPTQLVSKISPSTVFCVSTSVSTSSARNNFVNSSTSFPVSVTPSSSGVQRFNKLRVKSIAELTDFSTNQTNNFNIVNCIPASSIVTQPVRSRANTRTSVNFAQPARTSAQYSRNKNNSQVYILPVSSAPVSATTLTRSQRISVAGISTRGVCVNTVNSVKCLTTMSARVYRDVNNTALTTSAVATATIHSLSNAMYASAPCVLTDVIARAPSGTTSHPPPVHALPVVSLPAHNNIQALAPNYVLTPVITCSAQNTLLLIPPTIGQVPLMLDRTQSVVSPANRTCVSLSNQNIDLAANKVLLISGPYSLPSSQHVSTLEPATRNSHHQTTQILGTSIYNNQSHRNCTVFTQANRFPLQQPVNANQLLLQTVNSKPSQVVGMPQIPVVIKQIPTPGVAEISGTRLLPNIDSYLGHSTNYQMQPVNNTYGALPAMNPVNAASPKLIIHSVNSLTQPPTSYSQLPANYQFISASATPISQMPLRNSVTINSAFRPRAKPCWK